jgi:hypothetical protein
MQGREQKVSAGTAYGAGPSSAVFPNTLLLSLCMHAGLITERLARVTVIGCEFKQLVTACITLSKVARTAVVKTRFSECGGAALQHHEGASCPMVY